MMGSLARASQAAIGLATGASCVTDIGPRVHSAAGLPYVSVYSTWVCHALLSALYLGGGSRLFSTCKLVKKKNRLFSKLNSFPGP